MDFAKTLSSLLGAMRENQHQEKTPDIRQISNGDAWEHYLLYDLGAEQETPRTRKQIYTLWRTMQKDPQIAEALSLHITAALGGHETTGDVIFIAPSSHIQGAGRRAKELRQKVAKEAKLITPIINRHAFTLARQAVGYGDSFARIYTNSSGVVGLLNNEYTDPTLIQAFEQAGKTVGFLALENTKTARSITRLNAMQMLRIKMPRTEMVEQALPAVVMDNKHLLYETGADAPVLPSLVGGSFLYPVESAWKDSMISLTGLNNQQIADSVKQAFLTVNMDGMTPDHQEVYTKSLTRTLINYKDKIKNAFTNQETLYGTQFHILPTWGDKQTVTSLGDFASRQAPLSPETLMVNLRRVAGGLGLDLSLVGWADMLAGGLGDGAAFHTSAQIMRRSMLIRGALIDGFNHLMSIHWGLKYNEFFKDGDYPWVFEFYSDQGAATTEALTNKQMRMNTLTIQAQALQALKEVGLSKESVKLLLADIGGLDNDKAELLADDLDKAEQTQNPMGGMSDEVGDDTADDVDNDTDDEPLDDEE